MLYRITPQQVKNAIKGAGFSLYEVIEKAGVSQATGYNNLNRTTPDTLDKIISAFNELLKEKV